MKILVVGKFYNEGFALHIAETFEDLGHSVIRFDPGYNHKHSNLKIKQTLNKIGRTFYELSDSLPAFRNWHMDSLWSLLKENRNIDLIFSCYDFLLPSEVVKIKQITSAKITMWFPDALVNFQKACFLNAPYDALFFKDPFIIRALGDVPQSKIYYLPECFNPQKHFFDGTKINDKYCCDITTVGTMHSWRTAFFEHLIDYDVKIWGPKPPSWLICSSKLHNSYQGSMVHNQEKAEAFLGAKIVLNNLHYGEIDGLNVRAFEAAGIGAFQLINWRYGLNQLFLEDKEIVSFNSVEDLKNKLPYWLKNSEKRAEIRYNGKKRAYADHTYALRLNLLLDTLFGKASGFTLPYED